MTDPRINKPLIRCVSCGVLEGEQHKHECTGEPKPRPQVLFAGNQWCIEVSWHEGQVGLDFLWTGHKASSTLQSDYFPTEREACAGFLQDLKKERRLAQAQLEAIDAAIERLGEEGEPAEVCRWCGKSLEEHRDLLLEDRFEIPCGMLKSGFARRGTA